MIYLSIMSIAKLGLPRWPFIASRQAPAETTRPNEEEAKIERILGALSSPIEFIKVLKTLSPDEQAAVWCRLGKIPEEQVKLPEGATIHYPDPASFYKSWEGTGELRVSFSGVKNPKEAGLPEDRTIPINLTGFSEEETPLKQAKMKKFQEVFGRISSRQEDSKGPESAGTDEAPKQPKISPYIAVAAFTWYLEQVRGRVRPNYQAKADLIRYSLADLGLTAADSPPIEEILARGVACEKSSQWKRRIH